MQIMGVTIGSKVLRYPEKRDAARISKYSTEASKQTRITRMDEKSQFKEQYEQQERCLCGAAITDYI